uniref:Hypothetical secreted peptide n=1 Tax=Simulium nigrimanum TaxID=683695 RepID=D1FPX3_SIMNI
MEWVFLVLLLVALSSFRFVSLHPQLGKLLGKNTAKPPAFTVNPRTSGSAPSVKPVPVPQSKYETIYTAVKGSPKLPQIPPRGPIAPPRVESLLPFNQRVQFSLFPGEIGFRPRPNIKIN